MCAAVPHTGLIGTAPSQELLDIWNKREAELVEAGPEGTTLGGVLHTRPLGESAAGWWAAGASAVMFLSVVSGMLQFAQRPQRGAKMRLNGQNRLDTDYSCIHMGAECHPSSALLG